MKIDRTNHRHLALFLLDIVNDAGVDGQWYENDIAHVRSEFEVGIEERCGPVEHCWEFRYAKNYCLEKKWLTVETRTQKNTSEVVQALFITPLGNDVWRQEKWRSLNDHLQRIAVGFSRTLPPHVPNSRAECAKYAAELLEKMKPVFEMAYERDAKAQSLLNKFAKRIAEEAIRERMMELIRRAACRQSDGTWNEKAVLRAKAYAQGMAEGELHDRTVAMLDSSKPKASNITKNWRTAGLPDMIVFFFEALEKHGGETSADILRKEVGIDPSALWSNYPTWRSHLNAHCHRPRRGVYRLKEIPQNAIKKPVTSH